MLFLYECFARHVKNFYFNVHLRICRDVGILKKIQTTNAIIALIYFKIAIQNV